MSTGQINKPHNHITFIYSVFGTKPEYYDSFISELNNPENINFKTLFLTSMETDEPFYEENNYWSLNLGTYV